MENELSLLEMLQSQIRQEKENYNLALKGNREFWELKIIHNRIKELEDTLQTVQDKSNQLFLENLHEK